MEMKIHIYQVNLILTWIFQIATPVTVQLDFLKIKDIMSQILGQQLKNIIIHNDEDGRRTQNVHIVNIEKEIENKITDMKDTLQDDGDVSEKTTILEFVPKDENKGKTFRFDKKNIEIEQYNNIRKSIDTVLSKSSVPDGNKKLILITFDNLINQLLRKQCAWNSALDFPKFKANNEETKFKDLSNIWKTQFENLKSNHSNYSNPSFMVMLKPYHDLFLQILHDFNTLSEDYEIKCDLVQKGNSKNKLKNNLEIRRSSKAIKNGCKNFKVCSNELKGFLKHFYETLNETATTAFKTFADMYAREADDKYTSEGKNIHLIMEKTIEFMSKIVAKIFIQELAKLKLSESKNRDKNIQIIKYFVEDTIEALKSKIYSLLSEAMAVVKRQTRENVIADVQENLDLELGNLVKDTHDKICLIFDSCKGIVSVKRRAFVTEKKTNKKGSRIFEINLNVDLDDEAADILLHNERRFNDEIVTEYLVNETETTKSYEHEYQNVTLTRTTIKENFNITTSERYPKIVENEIRSSELADEIEITTNTTAPSTRTFDVDTNATNSNFINASSTTSPVEFSNATSQIFDGKNYPAYSR